jgi:hypothetical protein
MLSAKQNWLTYLDAYVEDALVVMRGQQITVELKFDKATAAWAKDRIWHPSQQTTLLKNGQLLMTLQVADTRDSSAGF